MNATHTDWCNTQLGYVGDGACDCDGGRCPICRVTGPCGFTADGEPLICRTPKESHHA